MGPIDTPVLVIYFNRPHTLRQVIRSLSGFQPAKLYIAGDGPRADYPADAALIAQSEQVIKEEVTWRCEIRSLQSDDNLGCDLWVPKAISWFFTQVDRGIILEDDCVITSSFAQFATEMLKIYSGVPNIMGVSAANFQERRWGDGDYYFSRYPLCWGWATWARAWKRFDPELTRLDELLANGLKRFVSTKEEERFWRRFFRGLRSGKYSFWDGKWVYSVWSNDGVIVAPNVNLVSNVGYGENATHTKEKSDGMAAPIGQLDFPLRGPAGPTAAVPLADRIWFRTKIRPTLLGRLRAFFHRLSSSFR